MRTEEDRPPGGLLRARSDALGAALALALAAEPVPLDPAGWDRARLIQTDEAPRLALFDPEGARLVDPATGDPVLELPGAVDLLGTDTDGDGQTDLVRCGADGLWVLRGVEPQVLSRRPCRAVARIEADRILLVAVFDRPWRWGLGAGGPVDLGAFGAAVPEGPVRLVPGGDSVAILHAAGVEVWGPFGQRIAPTPRPPDGAARLPGGWAWSAGGRTTGAHGLWFDDARSLVAVDLDADGTAEAAAIHPSIRMIGWMREGVERAHPLPFDPRRLLVGDLDGDGGEDLLVVGQDRLLAIPAAGPPPTTQRWQSPRAPAPTRPLAGIPVPLFQATEGTLASGRTPPRRAVVGGVGLLLGSTVGGALGLGASPAGFVTLDQGRGSLHGWYGLDSAPLFIQVDDDGGAVHLLNGSAGFTLGNAHLRGGPYLTAGLGGTGGGLRVAVLPLETRRGILHGLEWRAAATTGLGGRFADPLIGHVLLSWSTALPVGGHEAFDPSLPGVAARPAGARPEAVGICRRVGLTLGLTGGGSSAASAWEFVGRPIQVDIAASPAASGWCESGVGPHDLFLAVDSAPWFRYRIPIEGGAADIQLREMGAVSAGYHLGSDQLRVGPYLTAGVWALGAGARVAFTPLALGRAGQHGLEARALALWPSASAFQGWLGYTTWFDPRR